MISIYLYCVSLGPAMWFNSVPDGFNVGGAYEIWIRRKKCRKDNGDDDKQRNNNNNNNKLIKLIIIGDCCHYNA